MQGREGLFTSAKTPTNCEAQPVVMDDRSSKKKDTLNIRKAEARDKSRVDKQCPSPTYERGAVEKAMSKSTGESGQDGT